MAGFVFFLFLFGIIALNILLSSILDAEKRAKASYDGARNIHQTTSLGYFIDAADNPSVCGNCLDLPSLRGICPDIIRYVMGSIAWPLADRTNRDLDDGALAWEITRDFYSRPKNRQQGLVGPQSIRYDTWRCQAWDLVTHAGFMTHTHHDSNGLNIFLEYGDLLCVFT